MAELTAFGYRPGGSLFHRLDPRCKLFLLALISIATLGAAVPGLTLLTLVLLGLLVHIRISFFSLAAEIRYFLLFLTFVFLARLLSTPGDPLLSFYHLTITRQGIAEATVVCWRLLAVVLAGLVFMATTRPSAVREAVAWYLRPVPFIPENRVAVMMSLLMRFVPVILDQARETAEAQRSRCVECRKNPLYRLTRFTIPFLRRVFMDADRLVIAMTARCYTEDRTGPRLTAGKTDGYMLMAAVVLAVLIRFL